jgi:hypothetical protein
VLGRQFDVFRRDHSEPLFWTPPFETVPTHIGASGLAAAVALAAHSIAVDHKLLK